MHGAFLSRRSFLKAIGATTLAATASHLAIPENAEAFSYRCRYQYCEFFTAYFECRRPWLYWNEIYVCIDLFTSEFCGIAVYSRIAGCC